MFLPTTQEIALLKRIQGKGSVSKDEIFSQSCNQIQKRALEGCLLKGFIKIIESENVEITEKGIKCL